MRPSSRAPKSRYLGTAAGMTSSFQEPEVQEGKEMSNAIAGKIKFLIKIAGRCDGGARCSMCPAVNMVLPPSHLCQQGRHSQRPAALGTLALCLWAPSVPSMSSAEQASSQAEPREGGAAGGAPG